MVPIHHKENEMKLGQWIRNQRTAKKARKLDDNCIRRLTNSGMVWSVNLMKRSYTELSTLRR